MVLEVDALRRGVGLPGSLGVRSAVSTIDGRRTGMIVPVMLVQINALHCVVFVEPRLAVQGQMLGLHKSVELVQLKSVALRNRDGADFFILET